MSGRCKVLVEHDLVDQLGERKYRLTEFGEAVLEKEIPLDELNENAEK